MSSNLHGVSRFAVQPNVQTNVQTNVQAAVYRRHPSCSPHVDVKRRLQFEMLVGSILCGSVEDALREFLDAF